MNLDPDDFQNRLSAAVEAYDHFEVERLCNEWIVMLGQRDSPYPADRAKDHLQTLRNRRYFEAMLRVGDALLRIDPEAQQIRRQYAQALLDLGQVSAALAVLERLAADTVLRSKEGAEARGLIGRAWKQAYVDAANPASSHHQRALLRAIDAYAEVHESDPPDRLWHGVNAVSLCARARRDGIDLGTRRDECEIAEEILDRIREKDREKNTDAWDLATAAEACLPLGETAAAAKYLRRYVAEPRADAFEIASTLRQFKQVWQLDRGPSEARSLLDMLEAALLQRSGGELRLEAGQIRAATDEAAARTVQLEALLGDDRYQPYTWLQTCLRRARAVARFWRGGRGFGTGFLLPGEALRADWAGRQILLTNHHVVQSGRWRGKGQRPAQVEVTFDALHPGLDRRFRCGEVLWESPPDEHDTTCVALDGTVEGIEPMPLADAMPSSEKKDRVYVIGHPGGGELSFSFHDNRLLERDEHRLRYRSPTAAGSSGSPLFNDCWELIGIHHAGGRMPGLAEPETRNPANEGIPIDAIRDAIANTKD